MDALQRSERDVKAGRLTSLTDYDASVRSGRVFLTREARSHFEGLPPNLQDPVDSVLTEIEADPHTAGKQLLGRLSRLKGVWSARVGNYRILYTTWGKGRSPRVIIRVIRHRAVVYQQKRSR